MAEIISVRVKSTKLVSCTRCNVIGFQRPHLLFPGANSPSRRPARTMQSKLKPSFPVFAPVRSQGLSLTQYDSDTWSPPFLSFFFSLFFSLCLSLRLISFFWPEGDARGTSNPASSRRSRETLGGRRSSNAISNNPGASPGMRAAVGQGRQIKISTLQYSSDHCRRARYAYRPETVLWSR